MDYHLMHPPFEMKDFEEMTKKEARIHFEWYVNEIPARIALLRRAYQYTSNRSEKDLDLSPESLIPLWDWFINDIAEVVDRTKEEIDKDLSETPKWVHDDISTKKLSTNSQGVSLDVGIYLAETLRRNIDSLYWGVNSTAKRYVFYNKPILMHPTIKWFDFQPAHKIIIQTYKLRDGNSDKRALYNLYKITENYILNGV